MNADFNSWFIVGCIIAYFLFDTTSAPPPKK